MDEDNDSSISIGRSPIYLLYVILSGVLWGATDPLLKLHGSKKEEGEGEGSLSSGLVGAFGNWRFGLAFVANQLGSVAFIAAVAGTDVTFAVPVANGIKFAVNFVVGR